jgi:hypothetical protein
MDDDLGRRLIPIERVEAYKLVHTETVMTAVTMKKEKKLISLELLCRILRSSSFKDPFFSDLKRKVYEHVKVDILISINRKIPLNEIPLYIGDYPEIASWRLRIGK